MALLSVGSLMNGLTSLYLIAYDLFPPPRFDTSQRNVIRNRINERAVWLIAKIKPILGTSTGLNRVMFAARVRIVI